MPATRSGSGAREASNNLRRLTKFFTRKLKLELPRISTDDYINRFATQLGLSRRAIERAHELHGALPKRFRQAKPPLLLAAAILYLASKSTGEKVTIKKITNMMGVGVSNLSRTARSIRELVVGREA